MFSESRITRIARISRILGTEEQKIGRVETVKGLCAFDCLNCDLWDFGIILSEFTSRLGEDATNL